MGRNSGDEQTMNEPHEFKRHRQKQRRGQPSEPQGTRAWSVPISLAEIPNGGRHVELKPDAAICQAVAAAVGVAAVPRLEASFDLSPLSGDGVRVAGTVSATVEQNCVVTLEPLLNEINESVDLVLVQPGAMPAPRTAPDIDVAAEADAPDILHGNTVDLGAIAMEFLVLGIDPYPRTPGAAFEASKDPDPAAHPFAALAAWKKNSG